MVYSEIESKLKKKNDENYKFQSLQILCYQWEIQMLICFGEKLLRYRFLASS